MDKEPVGFRFHPTDEEIINHYLKLKMNGDDPLVDHVISEVDLTRVEPWELPDRSLLWSDDQVWYFYCRLDYNKYMNRKRANRTTNCGFWKVTGKIRDVKAKRSGEVIGTKRTLVFHIKEGRDCKPTRTDWVIHEYQSKTTLPDQRAFVLCKLKDKASQNESSLHEEGGPSCFLGSDFDDLIAQPGNLEGICLDDLLASPNSGFGSVPQVYTNEEEWADSIVVEPGDYYDERILGMNPSGSRIYKHEHQAGYQNLVGEEEVSSRRIQLQGETSVAVCEKARDATRDDAAVELTPKRSPVVAPKQDREMARVITAKPTIKLQSNRSRGDDRKSAYIRFETPKSGHEQSPPSVYIVNVVVGLLLFIIILWEMLTF
ncbi:hypothetical protein K2173_003381 [Erythroxylum novogranatense]|uniref:NAC domain-containing protein n=1 Tax=Erythroxylum novogranatense TaxID=1862640 RepID=A0AAV8S8V2_9ROSI|nr:hypothetical protein K2173_003381 [Erythroxylum novogranatense]